MAFLELSNLTKKYGNTAVVSDVSLKIEQGELVAFLGPSGCGKTTTLQMLAGFIEITSGEIHVDSNPMRDVPPHRRNIGVVFQSYALFPHLTVYENVAFGLKMRRLDPSEMAPRVKRALDMVQLTSMEGRYPKALSGGQQQRVALARALVIEPAVLLLDEPLSNLDANLREQMRFEIREIQKRIGITTVFVTHDQSEAMAVADRLVIMSKGVIRQVGTARQIYETPTDLFVAEFIGQANIVQGEVVSTDAAFIEVRLSPTIAVKVQHKGHVRSGQRVTIALRPEMIRLARQPQPGMNNLSCDIVRLNYLGSTLNAGVQVDGFPLTVILPAEGQTYQEGEKALLCWPPSAGIIFPEDS